MGYSLHITKVTSPLQQIGARGFEPPTFCSQSRRANRAALRPEKKGG